MVAKKRQSFWPSKNKFTIPQKQMRKSNGYLKNIIPCDHYIITMLITEHFVIKVLKYSTVSCKKMVTPEAVWMVWVTIFLRDTYIRIVIRKWATLYSRFSSRPF